MVGSPKMEFLVILGAYIFGTFHAKVTLLYGDMKYFIGLSMALECVTLNNLDTPF